MLIEFVKENSYLSISNIAQTALCFIYYFVNYFIKLTSL